MSSLPKNFFVRHEVFKNYACNNQGEVINVKSGLRLRPIFNKWGYTQIHVYHTYESGEKRDRCISTHRFVWECFNSIIPSGMQIDHLNKKRDDNRLCNLELVTPSENNKRAMVGRDTSYCKYIKKNPKKVIATDMEGHSSRFDSMYKCSKELGINHGLIKSCCERKLGVKSGVSKVNGKRYKFEYL